MNRNGDLNTLKELLSVSDTELETLARIASLHLYEHNFDSTGFVALLERRVDSRSFRASHAQLQAFHNRPNFHDLRRMLRAVLSHPHALPIMELDAGFMDPHWQSLLPKIDENRTPLNADVTFHDLKHLLNHRAWEEFLSHSSAQGRVFHFFQGFLNALKNIPSVPKLSQHLAQSNIQELSDWVSLINQSSGGLFSGLSERIRTNPEILDTLFTGAESFVAHAFYARITFEFAKQKLSKAFWVNFPRSQVDETPSQSFRSSFRFIRTVLEQVRREQSPETTLLAYSMTLALENWITAHRAVLLRFDEGQFQEGPWHFPSSAFSLSGQMLDPQSRLSRALLRDFEALGVQNTVPILQARLDGGEFPPSLFQYEFHFTAGTPLSDVLKNLIAQSHAQRPIVDSTAFLRLYVPWLSGDSFLSLRSWDHDNTLHWIQEYLSALTHPQWLTFKSFLFDDLKIQKWTPAIKGQIFALFDDTPKARDRFRQWVDRIDALTTFDRPLAIDGVTSFYFYHEWLRNLRAKDRPLFLELFRLIDTTRIFEIKDNQAKFPGVIAWWKSAMPSNLLWLSSIATENHHAFLIPFEKVMRYEPLKLHSHFLRDLLNEHFGGIVFGYENLSPSFSDSEWLWLKRFIDSRDFRALWEFGNRHGSQARFQGLLIEVKRLCENGQLRNALLLLLNFQNERLQYLAKALLNFHDSGELINLLESLILLNG